MKENRYHIDESKLSGDMVNESVVAYRDAVAEPMAHHFVSSAALNDEDDYPISKLFSYEEVQKSIDDFIEKKDDASLWIPWEKVEAQLMEDFPWLK